MKPLEVTLPKGRLTVVTGVSGSGKTTMVLESLVPALQAQITGAPSPPTSRRSPRGGHPPRQAHRRDAHRAERPLDCRNLRERHDELRKLFARSPAAKGAQPEGGRLLV